MATIYSSITLPNESLEKNERTVLSHISRENNDPRRSNFIQVKSGYYRIVQRQEGDATADLYMDTSPNSQGSLPVTMSNDSELQDRVWYITKQHGAKNSFTIVPQESPTDGAEDTEYGGTVCVENGVLVVKRLNSYPIWNILLQEKIEYMVGKTDKVQVTCYFSIWEIGTTNCWTNKQGKISMTEGRERLPPNQLYQLIETTNERTIQVSSIEALSVTATDATIVKKFYFGTNKLNADDLSRYLSVQLETDAHDQGWADAPDRGLWSWFEIAIFSELPADGQEVTSHEIKTGANGEPLTWMSHRLPLGNEFSVKRGEVFSKEHELWKDLKEGDYIGVLACAQYRAWEGDARSGKLIIREIGITDD